MVIKDRKIELIKNKHSRFWLALQSEWLIELWGWKFINKKKFYETYKEELKREWLIKYGKTYFQTWTSLNIKEDLDKNQLIK